MACMHTGSSLAVPTGPIFGHPPPKTAHFPQYFLSQSNTLPLWQHLSGKAARPTANSCLHTYWQKNKDRFSLYSLTQQFSFTTLPRTPSSSLFITAVQGGSIRKPSARDILSSSTLSDKQVDLKTKGAIDFSFSWGCFSLNSTLCINSTFSYQRKTSVTKAFTLRPLHFKSSFQKPAASDTTRQHQYMRLFSGCRGVSSFKIITWMFKGKTCTVLSSRKSCRTLLGADRMSAECYLARNALCTQMKASSLLPIAGKRKKKEKEKNPIIPSHPTTTPCSPLIQGQQSQLYSCQSLEIMGM